MGKKSRGTMKWETGKYPVQINHLCEFLQLFNTSNVTKEHGMQSKPSNTDPQHQ